MTTTKEAAAGQWSRILEVMGIPAHWLNDRHTLCPFCDRKKYRYTNKTDNGDWICSCGAGNGFALVQQHLNCDFKTAAQKIDLVIGRKGDAKIANEKEKERVKLRKRLREMWGMARQPYILRDYLKSRGLETIPDGLRGSNSLQCQIEGGIWRGRTMLAQVKKVDGTPIAVHRTFLIGDERREKKLTPTMEPLPGAAIQLYEPGQELGIAEGIETAIACHELFDMPVWSCVSASLMESVKIPEGVKRVIVFADNDKNYTGQAAAYKLANRLVLREKLECDVMIPTDDGDWLDEYLKKQGG